MFNSFIYVIKAYYLLSAVQNKSRCEFLFKTTNRTPRICQDDGEEAKQTYIVNNRFVTQPSCLYLGTTRVTSRRNAPLPSSDILLSPWRQTGAGVRESGSASEISGEKGRNVGHCGQALLVCCDRLHHYCCGQYDTKYSSNGWPPMHWTEMTAYNSGEERIIHFETNYSSKIVKILEIYFTTKSLCVIKQCTIKTK
jgi:hypothetical protein